MMKGIRQTGWQSFVRPISTSASTMNAKPIKLGMYYGVCHKCHLVVPIERPLVNHVAHLLLTLVTLGLWSPIWITRSLMARRGWCARCGSDNVGRRT